MYPYDIFPGVDMYTICLCLAILAALIVFRVMADEMKMRAKLQNLCLYIAIAAIFLGYFSAVVFQALYNIKANGGFVINSSTGATFYGGLIGGAAVFLSLYFGFGAKLFKKDKDHINSFFKVADVAACAVSLAHAIGRIGCLFAGCCHGKLTDAWYGIEMVGIGKAVPTQLFEALFLLAIMIYLVLRIKGGKTYCLQLYMAIYGAWRFVIEYMRDDYRGTTLVKALTPSQFIALLMIAGAIGLIFLQRALQKKIDARAAVTASDKTDAE